MCVRFHYFSRILLALAYTDCVIALLVSISHVYSFSHVYVFLLKCLSIDGRVVLDGSK